MSVKLRITAWFTFMIIILMIMVVSFVFVVEDHSLTEDPTEELVKVVSINAARLGKDHDKDDMDKIKSYNDGVYCAVYNEQGQIIAGAMPDKVNYSEGFENGKLCTYETEEEAQEMLKLTKDSFRAKAKICQKIIFGPKVDYKEVKEELKC